MTASAKSLTAPATPAFISMPATDVRVMVEGLERLGYDTEAILNEVGLPSAALSDPDRRVSCETAGAIIERAQASRFTPNIGAVLASETPLGGYPLLDYVVVTADTVGDGLRQLARYLRLIGSPGELMIDAQATMIRVAIRSSPFGVEYQASLMVRHLAAETDGRFVPSGVSVRHRLDDAAGLARMLGCAVTDGTDWDGIAIDPAMWALPLRRRDPLLRRWLEAQAEERLARFPERPGVADALTRALVPRIAGGDTRMAALARELGLSERTLHRRLADEGTSYQDLLDAARKDAAGRYLERASLAIGEVAYLLGYSEPAAFHRAFKRWYGITPDTFRAARR